MNIQDQLKSIDRHIEQLKTQKQWIIEHFDQLESLPEFSSTSGFNMLDFDNLEHADILRVIKAIGGKWDKQPLDYQGEPRVNYVGELDGIQIRCWAGKPPPSCKIIEVDEDVPAQPATTRKVKKLVCKEMEAVAA